jgi:hypothetical protein
MPEAPAAGDAMHGTRRGNSAALSNTIMGFVGTLRLVTHT